MNRSTFLNTLEQAAPRGLLTVTIREHRVSRDGKPFYTVYLVKAADGENNINAPLSGPHVRLDTYAHRSTAGKRAAEFKRWLEEAL